MIEDFVALSVRSSIFSVSDDYSGCSLTNPMVPEQYKPGIQRKKVYIGQHVIVGANSTILPGVVLGDGVAVGAYSLIVKNCETWSIYFGCPAKRFKARKKDVLLLERKFLEDELKYADCNCK